MTACSAIHLRNLDHNSHLSQHLIPNPSPRTVCSEFHSAASFRLTGHQPGPQAMFRIVALARQSMTLFNWYNTLFISTMEPDTDADKVGSAMAWPARLPCLVDVTSSAVVPSSVHALVSVNRREQITLRTCCFAMQCNSSDLSSLVQVQCKAPNLDRIVGVRRPDVFTDNEPGNPGQVVVEESRGRLYQSLSLLGRKQCQSRQ